MTDEHLIESTQKLEEQQLQWKIQEIQNRAGGHALPPKGACHDCGHIFPHHDPLKEMKKFCDGECEESWRHWYQAQVRKFGPGFTPRSAS